MAVPAPPQLACSLPVATPLVGPSYHGRPVVAWLVVRAAPCFRPSSPAAVASLCAPPTACGPGTGRPDGSSLRLMRQTLSVCLHGVVSQLLWSYWMALFFWLSSSLQPPSSHSCSSGSKRLLMSNLPPRNTMNGWRS